MHDFNLRHTTFKQALVYAKTADVLADGKITVEEAKALQAQFRANAMENFKAADALEPLARGNNV